MDSKKFEPLYKEFISKFDDNSPEFLISLTYNHFFKSLLNKISTQYLVDGFEYNNNILNRYVRASNIAGGIDEIISAGMVRHRAYDPNNDWTKDMYVNEQYKVYAYVRDRDVYDTSIEELQAQEAFLSASNFGSFIGLIMKRFEDKKRSVWFHRLIEIYKQYPLVITLKSEMTDTEGLVKEITEHMARMRQPNTAYNLAGKENATPYEKQQITWNTRWLNEAQWLTARLFQQNNINNIGKVIWGDDIDFGDDSIVAILDEKDTLYLGIKQQLFNYQPIAYHTRINYYRHEIWTQAIIPFINGVMFKTKASGTAKTPLSSVITTTEVTVNKVDETTIMNAITTANSGFTKTENEVYYLKDFWPETNTGIARVNATPNSNYLGIVDVKFTLTAGSSNLGR